MNQLRDKLEHPFPFVSVGLLTACSGIAIYVLIAWIWIAL